jgi:hypothetical protein
MLSNLLERFQSNYENLNSAERETLNKWLEALSQNELTVEKIKDYVVHLVNATEKDLADVKESTSFWSLLFRRKQDIFLKARLKNYLTLQDFLTAPEKAKKHIEQSLKNINK